MVVDGSRESVWAAEAAVDLSNGTGAELHVVHVVSTKQQMPYPRGVTRERREALLESRKLHALTLLDKWVGWVEEIGARVAESHYREGKPERAIIALAEELGVGLVVMGGRKRDWLERLLPSGSSEGVLRHTNRPVLVVREPPTGRPQKVPRRG